MHLLLGNWKSPCKKLGFRVFHRSCEFLFFEVVRKLKILVQEFIFHVFRFRRKPHFRLHEVVEIAFFEKKTFTPPLYVCTTMSTWPTTINNQKYATANSQQQQQQSIPATICSDTQKHSQKVSSNSQQLSNSTTSQQRELKQQSAASTTQSTPVNNSQQQSSTATSTSR